ncbi:hypothetical protein NEDG_01097 [Nematocida displodere]|uniref:Uncharacterized protein n=1 Tax=Nematocida displodere TaxID=1805483 RepID=A0A177EAY1_9MICR|nr:hypothetical protein NEDG_01097 [Nematocida displodere]
MNTIVVVFEDTTALCLKSLAALVKSIPITLRVFPLLVHNQKIIKRWALTKTEESTWAFTEKEEKLETPREFTNNLRESPCIFGLDVNVGYQDKYIFRIDTEKRVLVPMVDGIEICAINTEQETPRQLNSIKAIEIGVHNFFKIGKTLLSGIKLKNKLGKKETVDLVLYIENIDKQIPSALDIAHCENPGIEVGKYKAYIKNKVLEKILSKEPLYFASEEGGIKIESKNTHVLATIYKNPQKLRILDVFQPFYKNYQNTLFINTLAKKHGDVISHLTKLFLNKDNLTEKQHIFDMEMLKLRNLPDDKRNQYLGCVLEMLNTLRFDVSDKRHLFIASLSKVYLDAIRVMKKEKRTGLLRMYIPARAPTGTFSLHYALDQSNRQE